MDKTWKFINDHAVGIDLMANDTFGCACADSVHIDMLDVPKLLQVEHAFGSSGVLAMMAKIRKCDPLKPLVTDMYKKAKTELKKYTLFEDLPLKDLGQENPWWQEYHKNIKEYS